MIRHILLIAAREFRQIATTRSFWVTLLIVPFALAAGPLASHMAGRTSTHTLMLIDPAGRESAAIRQRLELDRQHENLVSLARYADRYGLDHADPQAVWTKHDRWYDDADVNAFVAQGGVAGAVAKMQAVAPEGTPPFIPPAPPFRVVPTPPALAATPPDALGAALADRFDPPKGAGRERLDYAIYIPSDFGVAGARVRLFTAGGPTDDLMEAVDAVLTRDLRTRYLEQQGLSPATARTATALTPAVLVNTPKEGEGGQDRILIRSIVPLGIAYLLLMSLLLSGSWMLQGLVEERSNKLLETVLACVSPDELLYGKLAGTVAIGLTMVLAWIACAVAVAFATQGVIADTLRPALAPIASPGAILAMSFYFVAGYLMVSMIFLAIGAMSDSFRDAQSYLSPIMLVISLPFALLAQAMLRDPDAVSIRILSWIPLYTPFTMLARIGAGVAWWEVAGTALLLAAFVAIEFVLLGRVFRASLLSAGDRPGLGRIVGLMRGREAG